MTTRGLQTEFNFTLPLGYVDDSGTLHKTGTMRLATAADEILPLRDPRVGANQAYLVIILLSRVITRLGSLSEANINPGLVETEGTHATNIMGSDMETWAAAKIAKWC